MRRGGMTGQDVMAFVMGDSGRGRGDDTSLMIALLQLLQNQQSTRESGRQFDIMQALRERELGVTSGLQDRMQRLQETIAASQAKAAQDRLELERMLAKNSQEQAQALMGLQKSQFDLGKKQYEDVVGRTERLEGKTEAATVAQTGTEEALAEIAARVQERQGQRVIEKAEVAQALAPSAQSRLNEIERLNAKTVFGQKPKAAQLQTIGQVTDLIRYANEQMLGARTEDERRARAQAIKPTVDSAIQQIKASPVDVAGGSRWWDRLKGAFTGESDTERLNQTLLTQLAETQSALQRFSDPVGEARAAASEAAQERRAMMDLTKLKGKAQDLLLTLREKGADPRTWPAEIKRLIDKGKAEAIDSHITTIQPKVIGPIVAPRLEGATRAEAFPETQPAADFIIGAPAYNRPFPY